MVVVAGTWTMIYGLVGAAMLVVDASLIPPQFIAMLFLYIPIFGAVHWTWQGPVHAGFRPPKLLALSAQE